MQIRPPFRHKDKQELYELILACNVVYPSAFSADFVDLLKHLLVPEPSMRFSTLEIRHHKWFRTISFDALQARAVKPPYTPKYIHMGDASAFDPFPDEPIKCSDVEEHPEHFINF